jgi:serine/threonine protein kinase/tetratricopeptide (TPR) repeat protein
VTPERWQQARGILKSALEREASERSAFLREACAGDESLRREVESLLTSLDEGESFLESPVFRINGPDAPPELEPGQLLGGYEILRRIGEGGMGEVYLGRDTKLGRYVALKLLPAGFTNDEERLRRFEQEARAASALNHPNILTIHEIRNADSTYFIATEFIDGVTLRDHIAKRMLELAEALDVAAQIASALAAAHAAGVIHRDIKPENVMLRSDGIVKVLDFGLAKLALNQPGTVEAEALTKPIVKTNPGVVMGTVKYMSPEQARGHDVDARTDIWSLGVVLYEMVTGNVPFDGETSSHVIVSILESEPPPLARNSEVPVELARIVGKSLSKDREQRYQTAGELALDLKNLRQELEVEVRLKRSLQPGFGGRQVTAQVDALRAGETVSEPAAQTTDVVTPQPTSRALFRAVKRHQLALLAAAIAIMIAVSAAVYFFYPAQSVKAIDSLAVLPFVNASGDPNAEYLSDGISDSIINRLSRLPNIKVMSLNAVMRYKGRPIDPQQIARELNVRAVLMGRLVQRGDNLVISAELVDVTDNRRLWGGQYDRKPSDLLIVQNEIAREITEKLQLRLSGEEKQQLTKQYTENTEAYQLYLKGRYWFDKRTPQGVKQSIEYFQQAIKTDPNYALAHAGLANAFTPSDLVLAPRETMVVAKAAARKALEIDDTLAEAHSAQARVLLFYDWDWKGAEAEFKRAIELNPNFTEAHHIYAHQLIFMGQTEQAFAASRRALEIDPLDVLLNVHLGWHYLYARQYDLAIEQIQKAIELDSSFHRAHLFLGQAYEQKGMYKEALAAYQRALELEVDGHEALVMLGHLYAVSGNRAKAMAILEQLNELYKQKKASAYDLAVIYAGLDERDQALEWLRKAYEERTGGLLLLKVEPVFDNIRSDPRYQDLLRSMNLTS